MNKILLVTDFVDELDEMIVLREKYESEGFEVALCTNSPQVLWKASIEHFLVVNPRAYFFTHVISKKTALPPYIRDKITSSVKTGASA